MTLRKVRQSETLADQAYHLLKRDIVNGELKGGASLPEEKIAKNLGVSRTPLRDALNRLVIEGLVVQEKSRPARVACFTKEHSLEYMELRSLLEVNNIEKIIALIDETFIVSLKENLVAQRDAIDRNHYQAFIELDRAFHLLLASPNQNKEFKEMIHRYNTGVNRAFLILSNTVPTSAEGAYQEHTGLVEALERKDLRLAKNKMIVHLDQVEKRFLGYYESKGGNV